MAISIAVFPARNRDGHALVDACRELAEELYPGRAQVKPYIDVSAAQLLKAVAFSDVVIFDGTPEPHNEQIYHLFSGVLNDLEHVLIVSRSYLPINVRGMRQGGAPIYPHAQTNKQIKSWLREQLAGPDALTLPRAWYEKASLGVGSYITSNRKARALAQARHQIFLSYRGRSYAQARQLQQRIERGDFHNRASKKVLLYGPEELALADEILSPLLRWNVLSVISDVIMDCEEFWILETPDYLGSWWTRGELAIYAYFGKQARMRVYDLATSALRDAGPDYMVSLTTAQRDRMARFFTNSHPLMMAPESRETMRRLRSAGLSGVMPMTNDDVFSDPFWNNPLLECKRCSYPTSAAPGIDIDQFLTNQYPILRPIAPDLILEAAQNAAPIACPNPACSARYWVEPTLPRYLWYPLPVGPSQTALEAYPTYKIVPK